MSQTWESYEKAAEHGPSKLIWKIIIGAILIIIPLSLMSYTCGWFQEAGQVAQEEFGPRALLKKYTWFKDAAAELDKKLADLTVYENRFKGLKEDYEDTPRVKWAREDREQYNLWQSEVAGVKASYNSLAAEYNANMAKFNWRFTNVGDLPEGATEVLPREFKPYTN